MAVFVTEEFVSEVKSILKSDSHQDCESELINSIFNSSIDEVKNNGCKRLGGDPNRSPFLRKRIEHANSGKSSGYRLYFWLIIQEENIYLLFIHPKTGRRSGTNLTTDKQKELVTTFKTHREQNLFIEVELYKDKIVYKSDDKIKKEVF
jgi:hypothetical protein